MYARDAQASATLLSLLIFLWGAVSIAFVPIWRFGVYGVSNVFQVVVGALGLVYFRRTRHRPGLQVSLGFAAFAILYTLVLVPWTSFIWCAKGRPWEAFTVPHASIVAVALAMPCYLWLGASLMGLFAAESVAVYLYALHREPGALVPVTEPFGSIMFAVLGVSLLVVRDRRLRLALQHMRVQSEALALRRLGPLFTDVRGQLERHLTRILDELIRFSGLRRIGAPARVIGRSIDRLIDVRRRLGSLTTADPGARLEAVDQPARLFARDAEAGTAVTAAVVGFAGTITAAMLAAPLLQAKGAFVVMAAFLGLSMLGFALLVYLAWIRQYLSEQRARWLALVLTAAILPVVSYNQSVLLSLQRPFTPFLGQKCLMVVLGLVAVSRLFMGIALVIGIAVEACVLYFLLGMQAHRDRIPLAEPWIVVAFMAIGIALQVMQEQRRVASIRLLRAQSEASAMHRHASLFQALRDQLGSPLQTLVVGIARLARIYPPQELATLRAEVDRLLAVSVQLGELDHLIPSESSRPALDAERELRRHPA